MEQPVRRPVFTHQPVHFLLVDVGVSMDVEVVEQLCEALNFLFSLVYSLRDAVRIPAFGLSALSSTVECLFPLHPLKGNFSALTAAVGKLQKLGEVAVTCKDDGLDCCLGQGIDDVLSQFQNLPQASQLSSHCKWRSPSQLQVTLVTCHPRNTVVALIEPVLKKVDLRTMKKIQILSLSKLNSNVHVNNGTDGESENLPSSGSHCHMSQPNSPGAMGLVEIEEKTCNRFELEAFFKAWLSDCATDREHLQIFLPPATPSCSPVVIRCDVQERILDPVTLPFSHRFILQTTTVGHQMAPLTSNKTAVTELPVYQLEAVSVLLSHGLCESLLFGQPLSLTATSCWKLEWNEIWENQQNFNATCELLKEKDQILLTRLRPYSKLDQVQGYFAIIPGGAGCLLLKPVACAELLLPLSAAYEPQEKATTEVLVNMECSLNQLQVQEECNPLLLSSGLNRALVGCLSKQSQATGYLRPSAHVNKPQCLGPIHPALDPSLSRSRRRGRGRGKVPAVRFPTTL